MNKAKRSTVIISIVGVIIIAALAIIIIMLLRKKPEVIPDTTGGRGTVAVSENAAELREKIKGPVEDGQYLTTMNIDWAFNKSTDPSKNAYVENSVQNTRTVYFDVTLADTGQMLYSSPYIPVGGKIEKFALDVSLSPGKYPAIITYHLVDDDNNELTTLSVSLTLHIAA